MDNQTHRCRDVCWVAASYKRQTDMNIYTEMRLKHAQLLIIASNVLAWPFTQSMSLSGSHVIGHTMKRSNRLKYCVLVSVSFAILQSSPDILLPVPATITDSGLRLPLAAKMLRALIPCLSVRQTDRHTDSHGCIDVDDAAALCRGTKLMMDRLTDRQTDRQTSWIKRRQLQRQRSSYVQSQSGG